MQVLISAWKTRTLIAVYGNEQEKLSMYWK